MPRRIVIIGTTGSGKSTLARWISAILHVPHVELDALHWEANWTETTTELFRARVAAALEDGAWVVDGNYSKARDLIWDRADTLIWLDFPAAITFARLLRRTLRRAFRREELWAGNRESFHKTFLSRESILLWFVKSYGKNRARYPRLLSDPRYAHLAKYRFTRTRDVKRYLCDLQTSSGT